MLKFVRQIWGYYPRFWGLRVHFYKLCVVLLVTPLVGLAADLPSRPTLHDTQTMMHDGIARHFHVQLPAETEAKPPLIIVLHGLGGRATKLRYGLGINDLAMERGYALAFPQGLDSSWGTHWNGGFPFSEVDDVGFLVRLARDLQNRYDLDSEQTFVMGISMGGYMAYRLGCEVPEVFSAQAIAIGLMSGEVRRACVPKQPVATLHIHGTEDPYIPYDGFTSESSGWGGGGSVENIMDFWRGVNGATPTDPAVNVPDATAHTYRNPQNGREVTLLAMLGYGHDWPNTQNAPFSGAQVVMDFFDRVRATMN